MLSSNVLLSTRMSCSSTSALLLGVTKTLIVRRNLVVR